MGRRGTGRTQGRHFRSLSGWVTRTLREGIGTRRAALVGGLSVVALGVALGPLQREVSRAAQGLLFVVPVVAAAVLGSRRAAHLVAAAATVAFAFVIPPVGSVRVRVTQDLVALAVSSLVALVVGSLVARRIELLDAVERERSHLLRSVSHDLRTPLAAIRAAASDLATNDRLPPATARRFVELIGDESERLDRLVANLLSLSRIEAGADAPDIQAVDLSELVGMTVTRLGRVFTDVHLQVRLSDDLPLVQGDYTQLEQLLTNLLENAARHSPAGRSVVLEARSETYGILLAVSDDGPGVDPDDVATLFQPFRSGRIPGTSGIGLAICRAVVERHHGTIDVGRAAGGGAVFTVRIPHG